MNSYSDSGVNILVSSLIEFTYWSSQIYLLFFNFFVEKGTKKGLVSFLVLMLFKLTSYVVGSVLMHQSDFVFR